MLRRRRELFRITKYGRRFDRESGKFIVNIAYHTAVKVTPRTVAVSEAFGLGVDQEQQYIIYDNVELKIGPADVVLITGDSGSGKSVLLKALQRDVEGTPEVLGRAINIADVAVEEDKPLIETVGRTVEEGLELLSRVGLNDAFLFLRSYSQLSDGQRYRYRVAKMLESGAQWWVMDEFCATLDRDTAKIVAFNVQKLARQFGKAVLAATTHMDLVEDLHPSVHVHKRFGKEICIVYYPHELGKECSLLREIRIEPRATADYRALARALTFALLAGLAGAGGEKLFPLPLTAAMLLWINLVTDGAPAVSLALDPPDEDVMKRHPRKPGEGVLHGMGAFIITSFILQSTGTILLFVLNYYIFPTHLWGWPNGPINEAARQLSLNEARTTAFVQATMFELFVVARALDLMVIRR